MNEMDDSGKKKNSLMVKAAWEDWLLSLSLPQTSCVELGKSLNPSFAKGGC